MSRPNFILILTDQHRADHLGCYGNAIVRTPNIDRLAADGTAFEECFVATPVCMPNRASLLTGRMPSLHGVRHNGTPLSMEWPTFVEVLRAAGYGTALIGKSHIQNMEDHPPLLERKIRDGTRPVPGFSEARREDLHGARYRQESAASWDEPVHGLHTPFYGFSHVELCNEHGDLAYGDYARWLRDRDMAADAARGPEGALAADAVAPQAWRTSLAEELYPTSYIRERVVAYLEHRAGEADGEPFFLMCSFPDPHHPFTPPGRYWDMYDPRAIQLPPNFHGSRDEMPARLAWLHGEREAGRAPRQSHRAFAVSEDEARQAIALTYGMISMIDDAVGRILEALRDHGLASETIVVFSSDHGDFMGDHGLLLKGPLHYRPLIRVPLIWSDPQRAGGSRSDALVSTIDIGETILHRAGLASPNGAQGRSLPGVVSGEGEDLRAELLIEDETQRPLLGFSRPVRMRTLVAGRMRLSLYLEGDAGEMYDLEDDPHEMRNLWDEPSRFRQKADLLQRMARQMIELTDRSPLPTGRA